jgi:pyruvate/2-oxoglutarate dehydrogenase complex dihydrolipoamide dehydrogenase (E3) component
VSAAREFGIDVEGIRIDRSAVLERVRSVQRTIAAGDDSPDRVRELGATLLLGHAKLVDASSVDVDGVTYRAKQILLCTGSHPIVPEIPGLSDSNYVTSNSIWSRTDIPDRVAIIGGGPMAIESAQALTRLGVRVTVLESGPRILSNDEPELASAVAGVLRDEGVEIVTNVSIKKVTSSGNQQELVGWVANSEQSFVCDLVLVAVGREPVLDGLGLAEAGVAYTADGITVDEHCRTSLATVWAAGDVVGGPHFTHLAGHNAALVVRNAFFPGLNETPTTVPSCTFTDPELAHVGLTHAQAEEQFGSRSTKVWRRSLARSDRALADGVTTGQVLVVTVKDRVVGASILSPSAGELITEFTIAIRDKWRLSDLAGVMHVYPTHATPIGQLAASASFERGRRLKTFLRLVQR